MEANTWGLLPGVSYKLLCHALLPSSSYLNFPYITRLQRSQNSPHALPPEPALLAQNPYTTTSTLMQAVMSLQLAELVIPHLPTPALPASPLACNFSANHLCTPQVSVPHVHLRVQISVLVEEKQAAELQKLGSGFGRRRVMISTFCLLQRGTTGKGMKDGWRRLWEVVGTLTGLAGMGIEERCMPVFWGMSDD
ncbi:hypothetical protein OE88DRAFT_1734149 [Heliocybe sulcata]|uniref:Uncharacterized protein n=1 Tax=Heliocybe sulcata TaxID=5364 RepID=A0A5C3N741_9AGAM|nr:hypothetical protein OE88DRAFT_1734149 [Heliocybe sulcata]